jgi:DUF4097 and DUF4098 domain-containing protein YvlB
MKTRTKISMLIGAIAILLGCALVAAAWFGGARPQDIAISYGAHGYTAPSGNAETLHSFLVENKKLAQFSVEQPLTQLVINWEAGEVSIQVSKNQNYIAVQESHTTRAITEDRAACYTLENGRLTIYYSKSAGEALPKKHLTIVIPESFLQQKTPSCEIYTESADVTLNNLSLSDLTVSTNSGDVKLTDCTASNEIFIDTTSGSVLLDASDENIQLAKKIEASTTSGSLSLSGSAKKVSLSSTSGNLSFYGDAEKVSLSSTSGDVTLSSKDSCDEVEIETVSGSINAKSVPKKAELETQSGDITFVLPIQEESIKELSLESGSGLITLQLPRRISGFNLKYETVSGILTSHFKTVSPSDQEDTYLYGDCGAPAIECETVSGNLLITEIE